MSVKNLAVCIAAALPQKNCSGNEVSGRALSSSEGFLVSKALALADTLDPTGPAFDLDVGCRNTSTLGNPTALPPSSTVEPWLAMHHEARQLSMTSVCGMHQKLWRASGLQASDAVKLLVVPD
jgi:hypothetical protein